jgi:four helix bundle protein
MRDYRKLDVWAKAHELYLYVKTQLTPKLPREERFELTSQLLRASLSVPLNIVEGCGRFTDKDFAHFQDTSLGSINETRAMLINFLKFLRSSNNNPKP